jgi:hypothetical protein
MYLRDVSPPPYSFGREDRTAELAAACLSPLSEKGSKRVAILPMYNSKSVVGERLIFPDA